MITDNGGWTVIQRHRKNSQMSFNKMWREYEKGFGDLSGDFWAGLELIHTLTQRGQWEMRVEYEKEDGTMSYLHYNQFRVGSASEEYPLTAEGFTGEGNDWFAAVSSSYITNKMKFSTPDNDNDNNVGNCASIYMSGWWHNSCYAININRQPPSVDGKSVVFSEMKIRAKDCIPQ